MRFWLTTIVAVILVIALGISVYKIEDRRAKAAQKAALKAANLAARKAKLGSPLDITATLIDGTTFSTESLKGKVVLVHFWASWCPDCQAELPTVIKLYKDYHEKGLEIVGISSDRTHEDLKDFLGKHPEMPWRQFYTPPAENARHPLNNVYKVDWIPTVFILDKQGTLRGIEGVKEAPTLIPKLLAE